MMRFKGFVNTEIECRILEIDVKKIEQKLENLGAKKIAERNMRRYVYDFPDNKRHSWIRLRDNGEKITLTVKEIQSEAIDGTKEWEIEVSNFNQTNDLLGKLGFLPKAYQENKRISYILNDVEIEIDLWPKIPPYVEFEAKSVKKIEETVKLLGFNMSDTTTLDNIDIYKKYGINLLEHKNLRF